MNTEKILEYPVTFDSKANVLNDIVAWLQGTKRPKVFVCVNPHSLVVAERDREFQQVFHEADLVTPDGVGIVMASKFLGGRIVDRITGSDVYHGLSELLNKDGEKQYSYFFLGSTDETLAKVESRLADDYPHIRFAGSYSPPYKAEFSEEDNDRMLETINDAKPDVLWVGMTAPKQEKWILRHKDQLDVKFIGAIGAVFDFYAGNVKRSHPVFQKLGLEWLPRLLQEPRRLWRRNFVSNPKFVLKVIKHKLRF